MDVVGAMLNLMQLHSESIELNMLRVFSSKHHNQLPAPSTNITTESIILDR